MTRLSGDPFQQNRPVEWWISRHEALTRDEEEARDDVQEIKDLIDHCKTKGESFGILCASDWYPILEERQKKLDKITGDWNDSRADMIKAIREAKTIPM